MTADFDNHVKMLAMSEAYGEASVGGSEACASRKRQPLLGSPHGFGLFVLYL